MRYGGDTVVRWDTSWEVGNGVWRECGERSVEGVWGMGCGRSVGNGVWGECELSGVCVGWEGGVGGNDECH